jgi:hypothetical protein
MTREGGPYCAGLLTLHEQFRVLARVSSKLSEACRSEQFRPLRICALSDDDSRDELFFSLFQVSELSQPI